jgi:hypothetical protein
LCVALGVPAGVAAQGRQAGTGDAAREFERVVGLRTSFFTTDVLAGPVVTDSPFSADATTRVTQVLGDGTRIEQTTNARFYRDHAGRVRREQTILGLGALGNMQTVTIAPDPTTGTAFTLDPTTRTARRVPRIAMPLAANMIVRTTATTVLVQPRVGVASIGAVGASRPAEELLGTRQFEGVRALGRKTTTTIPTGQIGNDRPIEIIDERWESPELRMLVYSRNSDPRTGVVEYRLTNINRTEPPPDLFTIPSDYTINQPPLPPPAPAPPGLGSSAPGERGGRSSRDLGPGTAGRPSN